MNNTTHRPVKREQLGNAGGNWTGRMVTVWQIEEIATGRIIPVGASSRKKAQKMIDNSEASE